MQLAKNIRLQVTSDSSVKGASGVKVYTGRPGRPVTIRKGCEGAWLKGEIVASGVSIRKAADIVGIPRSTMFSYTSGRVAVRPYTRRLISKTLDRHFKSKVSIRSVPEHVKCRVVGSAPAADRAQRAAEVYAGVVDIITQAVGDGGTRKDNISRDIGIVARRFFGGESTRDLSKSYGITLARVRSIIDKALAKIRDTPRLANMARELGREIAAIRKV